MIERQDRTCFESLDGNVASDLTDDGKLQQLADKKILVMLQVGYNDFEQVVGLTRNHVARDNLRELDDGFLECDCSVVRMTLNFHSQEDGKAKADLVPAQHRAIPFNIAFPLQPIDPSEAWRGGQSDAFGEVGVGEPAI